MHLFQQNPYTAGDSAGGSAGRSAGRNSQQKYAAGDDDIANGDSFVHLLNIEYSELWYGLRGELLPPPSVDESDRRLSNLLIASSYPLSTSVFLPGYPLWDRYDAASDVLVGCFAEVASPMLLLNGDLDSAAPFYNMLASAAAYDNGCQNGNHRSIVIPYSAHTTIGQSPVKTPNAPPCGAQIIVSFLWDQANTSRIHYERQLELERERLRHGRASLSGGGPIGLASAFKVPLELDLSCLDDLVAPDFQGISKQTEGLAQQLFGISSLWDD